MQAVPATAPAPADDTGQAAPVPGGVAGLTVPAPGLPVPDLAVPEPAADLAASAPAGAALRRVIGVLTAVLRLTCGVAGAAVALAVRPPSVQTPLLVAVVTLLTAWSVWFAQRTWRSGLDGGTIGVDLTLTAGTCLLIPELVAPEVLPGEVSWTAILASTSVIIAQLGLRPRWAVPAGLALAVVYALGALRAGNSTEAYAHAATLLVQTGSGTALSLVIRRSSRRADHSFATYQQADRQARLARAARVAERQHNRDLHDTVLSTLTMVGLGAATTSSGRLRERAAVDLLTLTEAAQARDRGRVPGGPVVALDERLRRMLDGLPGPPVGASLTPCRVPEVVADTLVESTAAALANVARHAPAATTTLRLHRHADTVVVEVTDDGPGFDLASVPTHRYGLRESICGRMTALGGRAEIHAAPGVGTRIRLEWTDGG